jgi:hypothetical protein
MYINTVYIQGSFSHDYSLGYIQGSHEYTSFMQNGVMGHFLTVFLDSFSLGVNIEHLATSTEHKSCIDG